MWVCMWCVHVCVRACDPQPAHRLGGHEDNELPHSHEHHDQGHPAQELCIVARLVETKHGLVLLRLETCLEKAILLY